MKKTKFLAQAAVIAAIYAALTLLLAPISYGNMQIRVSEALTILPIFTPAAIPGLFIGCLLSNLNSPFGIIDIVFGSLATLVAAFFTYRLRNILWLAPMSPVIINGVVVGGYIYVLTLSGAPFTPIGMIFFMGTVALGELIACYGLGYPLILALKKYKNSIFKD